MITNPVVKELSEKYHTIWGLQSAGSLLQWDLEVNLPSAAAESRGVVLAELELLHQREMSSLYPLIDKAVSLKDELNDVESGIARVLDHAKKFYSKVPAQFIEEIQKITPKATVAWRTARKNSDFKSFLPYLEQIVALEIKIADKLGYEDHRYSALLDLWEEDFSVRDADRLFPSLVSNLRGLLSKVEKDGRFKADHALAKMKYDNAAMERVDRRVCELLEMPADRFRMDVSTHPFTSKITRDDVRITTRFEGFDFARSVFSTIHESGHALYELQINKALDYTPVAEAASYGFHESQSRFWENVIGRSRAFISLLRPILVEELPFTRQFNEDDLFHYFNGVSPSLIRVDADELTYNIHIAIRYEIEKGLIGEKIKPSELPSVWQEKFEEYLGIRPKEDTEGALQDIHWSNAQIGYFPSYTLGNVIAGMLWHVAKSEIDLDGKTRSRDFAEIKAWLYEKVHKHGSIYSPKELSTKTFGEAYSPDKLIEYLSAKYLA